MAAGAFMGDSGSRAALLDEFQRAVSYGRGATGRFAAHCNPPALWRIIPSPSQNNAKGASLMSLTVRRVITGHDNNGHAIVEIDEVAKNVHQGRPGAFAANIWTTEAFPVSNDG